MSSLEQQIIDVLEQHVSPLTARSLLRRALETCQLYRAEEARMPQLVAALRTGIRLFVPEDRQQELIERLSGLGTADATPTHRRIAIDEERNITEARMAVRAAASSLGADAFGVQKVVTAVSELARNIVLYAGRGTVELETRGRTLRIVASDRGPGIRNLDEIMSGSYRSRTGLGRGLRGVKQLADAFDVRTGPSGTTIAAEFAL